MPLAVLAIAGGDVLSHLPGWAVPADRLSVSLLVADCSAGVVLAGVWLLKRILHADSGVLLARVKIL